MDRFIIVIIILVLLGSCAFVPVRLSTSQKVVLTVKDKERVNYSEDSKYLVFTENEVFENTDELFKGKFNSSDVYGQLEIGKSYNCEVIGWRAQFLSWYRNIIGCSII